MLENVKAGGLIFIPKNQVALGRITSLTPPHRGQRAAQLEFSADEVSTLDGQKVPLRAHFRVASDNRQLADRNNQQAGALLTSTQGLALPLLPLLLLKHGDDVELVAGLTITAFSSADITAFRDEMEYRQPRNQIAEPDHSQPKVTIYQLSESVSARVQLYCGKGEIGSLMDGEKITFSLPTGAYWFRTNGDKPQQLNLFEGQHYFLRSVMLPVGRANHLKRSLLPVDAMVGEIQTVVTRDVDKKNLKDVSQIAPGLLTADLSEKKGK